ncbi:fibronectin type III domain-containing protein [Tenacibaculum sp. 1_MG-2023]|uniref:fibronectin type III domain-containing protein n=1 Tax=Tenacibaculum sp. 1_MG-2023 TaxID=3062653 RepID=UPI0026E43107|nr:fibronectin type III domain-containing protein [Tenacibaculum sp. 1_MG-2023]MDO6674797.1 fibronectin type III domain-containing protein [Tenacibaculum sp. 1_MG-2023]
MNVSKLKYRLKQSLFFYCLLIVVGAYAQRYPVQVTQTIIPPYSTKLSDYATASDVKFRLNLLLTDVVASNKQVRLKLHIKGNGFDIQSTDFVAGASQVILNGGVLQQFTNIDLAAYFQPNNLIGISPQQYNKPLPEGMYSFCWEVYEAYTNQQLNHPTAGCSNVYLVLNDPPFLNLPYKGDQIVAQDPMNIIFQWTPRHTNATNVSYEFELRELWDTQVNPQAAFLASPNYYSETTYTTTLLYNIGKPTLLPNRRYGWRVKAKSTTGVSENSIFKNDGYSEIYYFTYTNACYPPTFVLSEVVAKDRVKLTWQGHPDHKKYHVQYKRADIPDAEWFEVYTYNTQAQISNLRAGKTYMFRVGGTCNELTDFDQNYSYSHMSQFTMPAKDEMGSSYNCGIIPEIQIDNNDPLKNIGINETFTAGDFPVTVKQIQGGNGTFTGVGYIVVPYLGDTKIAVTFDAISINTDYQLIEGVVKTTYDPTWGDMGDTNDWTQGGTGNSESTEVDFPVSDVQIDPNGDILVIGENGEVVELPGGEDIVITDSNGQVWAVDEEGNVTPQGTQAEGGASTPKNTNGVNNNGQATAISAKGVIVTFKKASNSKYGFDSYESNYSATKDLYKKLGNNYYVPYKAVAKNDTETIVANVAITDSKIKPQDIVFKTKEGVAITKIDSTATSYTLQLKGIFDDAEIETQALVKQGTKYEVAGAFIQYQAAPKNIKVVVVNTSNTNIGTIKESLQNIYKQAMVNLTITEINDFKNDLEALTPNGTIQSGESGFAAQYTEQQRQINNKLKQHPQYQQDAYYLIVTDKTPSSANEKGLMPLGRQFGYIYTANAPPSGVGGLAAHELGHGAFQLKHPFSSQSYQYAQKATNWLLDYKDGTKLPFVHWQTIHNPKLRVGVFDKDEEGQQVTVTDISELKEFANPDGSLTFIARSGKPITVPGNITEVIFSTGDSEKCEVDTENPFRIKPFGTLTSFVYKDKRYTAAWKCKSKKFMGYMSSLDNTYKDVLTKKSITKAIVGFPAVANGAIIFKVGQLSITPENGGENYTAEGDYQEYDFLSQRLKDVVKFNEISAPKFDPALSEEVQQFIIDNIYKAGFDGKEFYDNDAYVFVHATQLEKYNVLKGCFKTGVPGQLLKLIVKTHMRITKSGATSTYTSDMFEDSHEENSNIYNAKSLINHWKKYNLNYYPIVADQVSNFEMLKEADHDDIIETFRSIMDINYESVSSDNWDCFFEKLGFDNLTLVLKALSERDDWGNETENLLLKIFKLADGNDEREQKILDILKIENYKLLTKIVNITNDWADNNNPQFEDIVSYISKWLIARSPKELYKEMVNKAKSWNEIPFNYENYSKLNVVPTAMNNMFGFAEPNSLPYKMETSLKGGLVNITVSTGTKPGGSITGIAFKNTYSPYDYVVMDIRHDFKIGGKVFKEQKILVPRIFVHWLATNVNGKNNEAFLRVFTEVMAVAAIPLTGGASSILLTIDATLATADIVFTIANNVDNESLLGNEKFFNVWTGIYGIYNLRHLPALATSIGKGGKALFKYTTTEVGDAKFLRKLVFDFKNKSNFIQEFKKLSAEQKLDVIFKLDDLALAIKKESEVLTLSKRIIYRKLVELKLELNTIFKTPNSFAIKVKPTSTPYNPTLAIDYNNKLTGLGKVLLNENKEIVLVESSKWLPSTIKNTEELATIKNVLVETAAGSKGIKNISVVKNLDDGEIYLSLVGGLREDIIKLQVDELLALRDIHNPNKLNHNCFTCAIKYQNEFTKGTNEVIEEITKKYHAGVAPEEINKLIYDVFGFDNVKTSTAFNFDDLITKLNGIHQESVILIGSIRKSEIEEFASHHAFNARRMANREWEIIDIQNGARYDKNTINKYFISTEIFEILYKDHTYISRNILKRDLPKEVHAWVENIPKELLNTLEGLPYTKLQQFVREFDNKVEILSEFNKDPLLFKVWETMERSPNIPVSIRTKIANLQGAKRVICK